MNKKDLEAIGGLVDNKLKPINKKLDTLDEKVDGLDNKVDGLDNKVDGLEKKVDVLDEKVSAHSVSLINLEKEIKAYLDALDVERKRIDRHDERFKVLEESIG